MKKWIINVLHMSHTDIGYTDTQSRITNNQINYLIDLVEDYKNDKNKFKNWKWIAESFYVVELFMKNSSNEQKDIFIKMIKKGIISLSASYLNMSELSSQELYENILSKTVRKAKEVNYELTSAITNDVNGFSYGWASALANNKIRNLYFGLHTHHGMFPMFKKQSPFYWKAKNGKKILVWVGEHYQAGNEFGIVDTNMGNYILKSGFESGYFDEEKQILEGKKRMLSYLKNLEKDNYNFDNVPISVLGAAIDNAPYNLSIAKRIEKLNKSYENENIVFKMVTLEEFFENIEKENKDIQVVLGDWPDWWTDGTGSKPKAVRIFRQAQRNYHIIKRLKIESDRIDELEKNLILYSEHTFGTWDSIEDPANFKNIEVDSMKTSYASTALGVSNDILDKYTNRKILKTVFQKTVNIEIKNPFSSLGKELIHLNDYLSWKEIKYFNGNFVIKQDNKKIDFFKKDVFYMGIPTTHYYAVFDGSKHETNLVIKKGKDIKPNSITCPTSMLAADNISDCHTINSSDKLRLTNNTFENDFVKIKWNNKGIYSIVSLVTKKELLNIEQEGFFTPVYDLSEISYDNESMNLMRRKTGRNRRGENYKKYIGKITEVKVISDNPSETILKFMYSIEGCLQFYNIITICNLTNVIDVKVKLIKKVEWSLENLYLSIPFKKDGNNVKLDKGELFGLWSEQIPGTLIDYYAIQSGVKVESDKEDILLSSKDAHMMWVGTMNYEKRFLAGDKRNPYKPKIYSWIMNNYWETNFQASLGGFHEFNYRIYIPGKKISDEESKCKLKVLNDTIIKTRKI